MRALSEGQDINDPKVKTEIAEQVLPLIQDLPNAIERDTYLQQLARLLKVDERSLLSLHPKAKTQPRRRQPQFQPDPEAPGPQVTVDKLVSMGGAGQAHMINKLEEHCLSILMREPELIYKLDRALKQAELAPLTPEDFQNTIHQEFLTTATQSLDQDDINPVSFALDHIPFELLEKAEKILETSEEINPAQDYVLEDVLRAILRLRETSLQASNNQIRFLMEEAQETGSDEINQYNSLIAQNALTLLRIHKALASPSINVTH